MAPDYLANSTEALSGLQPWDNLTTQALPRAADRWQVRVASAPRSARTTGASGVDGPEARARDHSCESGGSRAETRRHCLAVVGAGTPRGPGEAAPKKPPRARAQGEGGRLRLPSSAASVCPCVSASSDSAGGCPGQRAPSPCLTRVSRTARSTCNPRSLKSTARAGRLPVFLWWPSIRSARLLPGRLSPGTRTRRGVGSGRVPPGRRKAGCLQVSPARLSGLL